MSKMTRSLFKFNQASLRVCNRATPSRSISMKALQPPPFVNTYGELSKLRLPRLSCKEQPDTFRYRDFQPAPDSPPRFTYHDRGLDAEAAQRFEDVIDILGVRERQCSPEAAFAWMDACKLMLQSNDWMLGARSKLMPLVMCLLEDALTHQHWEKTGFLSPMGGRHAERQFQYAGIRYDGLMYSLVLCEVTRRLALQRYAKDLQETAVLPGGVLENGRAMAKKMGLEQASLSKEHEVEARYGVFFSAKEVIVTSPAATEVDGQKILGTRTSSLLDLCSLDSGVSVVAILFGLMAPACVLPFGSLRDPRSVPTVWTHLRPRLSEAMRTEYKGLNPDSRGDFAVAGGSSSSGDTAQVGPPGGIRGYRPESFPSMTMRHPGPESVFNPTRHLVAISDRVLSAWETLSEESRDTLTESEDSLSPGPSRASESPESLPLGSPESPNRCPPVSADHLKPAHLEILSSGGNFTSTETMLDASLTLPGRLSKSCPVIMKVVHEHFNFDMVAREVKAYRQLQDLSVVVPHLFAVMREPADPSSAILVLENAGEIIGDGGWENVVLDESDKKDIYLALAQIHMRGVLHGDVMPWNVVRRPHGGMCFVGFGFAKVGHRCDPQSCDELVELRSNLGLPDNIIDDRAAGQEC